MSASCQKQTLTIRSPHPLGLTDAQLRQLMDASAPLPIEKRALLLERVAARLTHGPAHIADSDVEAAIASAMRGSSTIARRRKRAAVVAHALKRIAGQSGPERGKRTGGR